MLTSNKYYIKYLSLTVIFTTLLAFNYYAQVQISSIFTDNMVLQKGINIPIWGRGIPGSKIEIHFHNQFVKTKVNNKGLWKADLTPENYGGPYQLSIISKDTIKLKNVMVGEVWLCSGQSNMEMPVEDWGRVKDYKKVVANANYKNIRLLFIPPTLAPEPQKSVENSGWKICNSKNIKEFSAVAYFFGRELYKKLKVSIGLIDVTKGGTPIESWMDRASLKEYPNWQKKINFVHNSNTVVFDSIKKAYKLNYKNWLKRIEAIDLGYTSSEPWYKNIDISSWKNMKLPSVWEKEGLPNFDGVVWFKKKISIPDNWLNKKLILSLGPIQDYDITYFNGVKVGDQKRRDALSVYKIPSKLVNKNVCTITVRVLDNYGIGGIWGNEKYLFIKNEDGNKISLKGNWKYKPTVNINNNENKPPQRPRLDRYPTILFNGMIAPLINYGIKGFLWYQGESNASSEAYVYRKLFPKLIKSWRQYWGDDNLPFYFVQLANYKAKKDKPTDDDWADIRESQGLALNLKNTGMAVTIDIGDSVNIHYKNKQEVGRRLSLIALNKDYGFKVGYSGPLYNHYKIEQNKIKIYFDFADGLKTNNGKPPAGFSICGKNHKFYWAHAKIENNSVTVWSPKIKNPVAVRFEWASNPDCNLYNKYNLPAAPFRTDNYKLITQK